MEQRPASRPYPQGVFRNRLLKKDGVGAGHLGTCRRAVLCPSGPHPLRSHAALKKIDSLRPDLPSHYRPRHFSALWRQPLAGWREKLREITEAGRGTGHPAVYFRADDVGAGGRAFNVLCGIFRQFQVPIAMAVVPAWLSSARIQQLFAMAPLGEELWGWHQHGWRHVNWQRAGKKSEFGEQRPFEKQWRDIWQGQLKMKDIFGEKALPVFTPPWNRLSAATVKILQELSFSAVSTTDPLPRNVKPAPSFKNIRVHLDLHTRKSSDPGEDYARLLAELAALIARKEPFGIMVHHQRMTLFAFEFLEELLRILQNDLNSRFLAFEQLLQEEG